MHIRFSRHGQIVGSAFSRIAKNIGLDLFPANEVSKQPELLMVWLPRLTRRGGWLTARAERTIEKFLRRYPATRAINRWFAGNGKTVVADPIEDRFNRTDMEEVVATHDVLDASEIDALLRFTAALNMEYGELDAVRDSADSRLYVVDANNTPVGPRWKTISPADGKKAITLLSESLLLEFLPDTRFSISNESFEEGRAAFRMSSAPTN